MAWVTPELDWDAEDAVVPSDFVRIEGNTDYLKTALDAEIVNRAADVDAEEAARIAAVSAEESARIAADNTNASYHDGSVASAIKIEESASLPTASATYLGRIVWLKISTGVNTYASKAYICLTNYGGIPTPINYEWVEIAKSGLII